MLTRSLPGALLPAALSDRETEWTRHSVGPGLYFVFQLVTALLFDYDPADPSSLEQVKSNLQILADEAIPAFLSSADAQWDEDEEVRKALEEWSLNGGGWTFSETSSGSDDSSSFSTAPTSVDEGDDPSLEFLISLFPHMSVESPFISLLSGLIVLLSW